MDVRKKALDKHFEWNGKIEVISRAKITSREDLALAYTPGVAEACLAIADDPNKAYQLTRRNNLVGVITNGTAVLGLGNIGPSASMPVMEGKCVLFKEFADVDAFPICIESADVDTVVQTIEQLANSFGGINLEDIAAPECFEIERRLKKSLNIPVFHDDQHGTAIVVAAGLINALKLVHKSFADIKVVVNGAGSAGIAIAKHLVSFGVQALILADKNGILSSASSDLNSEQKEMLKVTNPEDLQGDLARALVDADVFIGVSAPNILTAEMVSKMASDAIVFAMANPTPEIMPEEAKAAGVIVMGTGRSDFPNQVNNVLAFPGVFKGALAVRALDINDEMKIAASHAIAGLIKAEELSADYIIPDALDKRVAAVVCEAVKKSAIETGVARI